MPEFKEESDLSVEPEGSNVKMEDEVHNETKVEEGAHYALKRGRIPSQKKNISTAVVSNVGEINIDAVRNDAIGVSLNDEPKANVQKTTSVVDKEINKKSRNFSGCKNSKNAAKGGCNGNSCQESKNNGSCKCKCGMLKGFFQKFLSLFGLKKKDKKSEKPARSYRYRNHNQRRRHAPNGNR